MKFTHTRYFLLAATIGVGALAASSHAQQRTNDDGRLLDASNRIGSGGLNSTPVDDRQKVRVTGNDIFSGNVSGGVDFRGRVSSPDPGAFRGNLGSDDLDRFIKRSSGVPQPYSPKSSSADPQPFYSESRVQAPPPGFVRGGPGQRNYVYSPAQGQSGEDLRLSVPLGSTIVRLPKPGQLDLPGPVDPTANDIIYSASPLYGVRTDSYNDRLDSNNFADSYTRRAGMDDVQTMRDELARTIVPANPNGATEPEQSVKRQDSLQNPALQATGSPNNAPLDASKIASGELTQSSLPGDVVPAPEQQSTQYAQLQERYKKITTQRKLTPKTSEIEPTAPADVPKKTPDAPKQPGGAEPRTPGLDVKDYSKETREQAEKAMKGETDDAPLDIKSLATGVKARGLADLLIEAETLMKAQKFETAIDRYTTAEQVAPNNPLIWIGKAHAELGAGYFALAEAHLRQAFSADPSLLMARYDLPGFFGEERLQTLLKDLKDLANKDTKSVTPPLLLGYIAYNTGNERRAAAYLDVASKRAGDKDKAIIQLRDNWLLPTDVPPDPEFNK